MMGTDNTKYRGKEFDLDAEIADLDEFIDETVDEAEENFQFDDDLDDFVEQPRKKRGFGKVVVYTILILFVGAVVYLGLTFTSKMMGISSLSELESTLTQRSTDFSDDFGVISQNEPMPTAMDEEPVIVVDEPDDLSFNSYEVMSDNGFEGSDLSISEVDVTIVPKGESLPEDLTILIQDEISQSEEKIVEQVIEQGREAEIQTAATIAEALAIAQSTTVEDDQGSNQEENSVEESDIVDPVQAFGEEIIPEPIMDTVQVTALENEMTDQIPSAPVVKMPQEAEAENLSPSAPITGTVQNEPETEEEKIVAVEVPELTVIAPVEELVAVETLPSEASAEQTQAKDMAVEKIKAKPFIKKRTKKIENLQNIDTVQAKPRLNAAAQLAETSDPRLVEGQKALSAGDFVKANEIFSAILVQNPAYVPALTGKQMALGRVRGTVVYGSVKTTAQPAVTQNVSEPVRNTSTNAPQSMMLQNAQLPRVVTPQRQIPRQPAVPIVVPNVETVIQSSQPSITALQSLTSQFNANPRDAVLALKLGDAYRQAGDNTNAVAWYRKALQLDALYKAGIDRMRVYDHLADIQ